MRESRPFFRRQTKSWYVQLDGRQVPLGKDKAAAFATWHDMMGKRRAGQVMADDAVCHLLNKYLAHCERNRAAATFEKNRFHLRRFAQHIGPNLKVSALKPYHVQEWIDEHYRDTSDTYKHTAITVAKGALEWAAKMGYIDHSPIAKMQKPRPAVREQYIPSVRWADVVAAARGRCFRDYLIVALSSGARPQEMRKIEAQHFEPDRRRIVFPIAASKGKKRQRVIYLDDLAFEVVARLAADYPDGLLFRDSRNNPWKKDAIKDRFKRLRIKLGIKGLCATVLRHSYAHHMLATGTDSLIVSKLLGHVDGRMLATRYGHVEQNEVLMLRSATQTDNPLRPLTDASNAPRRTA